MRHPLSLTICGIKTMLDRHPPKAPPHLSVSLPDVHHLSRGSRPRRMGEVNPMPHSEVSTERCDLPHACCMRGLRWVRFILRIDRLILRGGQTTTHPVSRHCSTPMSTDIHLACFLPKIRLIGWGHIQLVLTKSLWAVHRAERATHRHPGPAMPPVKPIIAYQTIPWLRPIVSGSEVADKICYRGASRTSFSRIKGLYDALSIATSLWSRSSVLEACLGASGWNRSAIFPRVLTQSPPRGATCPYRLDLARKWHCPRRVVTAPTAALALATRGNRAQ